MQHGILHECTKPYSPQSNGVVERKKFALKEMMNVISISSSLPQNIWDEVILLTNYILNKVTCKKLDKTPYELWKCRGPSYQYLKVWECLIKVAVPTLNKIKLCPKIVDCIFICYEHKCSACLSIFSVRVP